jgi:two-component system chemotaxis sensor kinase CheA
MSTESLAIKCQEVELLLSLARSMEDPNTLAMLQEALKELLETHKQTSYNKELYLLGEAVLVRWDTLPYKSALKEVEDLLATYKKEVPITEEPVLVSEGGIPDLQGIDSQFLTQLIEKHTATLEELENKIIDTQRLCENGNKEDKVTLYSNLDNYIKQYLHNLKGEASVVGLHAIETVTHEIESSIKELPIECAIDGLRQFIVWCYSCLKSHAVGKDAPITADSFVKSFQLTLKPNIRMDSVEILKEIARTSPPKNKDPKQSIEISDSYSLTGDYEVLGEFTSEAEEHLLITEQILIDVVGAPDTESINAIFRCVHSIKGASAYFGLEEISKTSHVTENLIDEARSGKRVFDPGLTDLMLAYVDLQKKLLKEAKSATKSGGMLHKLEQTTAYLKQLKEYTNQGNSLESATNIPTAEITEAAPIIPELAPQLAVTASLDTNNTPNKTNGKGLDIKNFVKVETSRLDHLIDTIGEMCTYNQMLIKICRQFLPNLAVVNKNMHQVEKISRELRDIGMSMRLDPIRGLFQKMSRLVWDTAKKLNKQINFKMEGEDTELDRTLIEKLADPLMHMVRNALDHGIEKPEDRVSAGKNRSGTVQLKAFHAGGAVHIQIIDDGRGLDTSKLLKKAIEKGIADPGKTYTEEEIYDFIFAPGFSTAAVVTDLSGRGVGMDVVKRNIEGMRGRVIIKSAVGQGTIFTIELPLTLAIIDGIEIKVGVESYIIPALSVVELMRPDKSMLSSTLNDGETFHFRGQYLPLFRLGDLFNVEPQHLDPLEALIIVIESGGEFVALMVDEVLSTQSIVIKKLGDLFHDTTGITGCAILADGNIGLILDTRSLVSLARSTYRRRFFEASHSGSTESPQINHGESIPQGQVIH